MVNQLMRPHLPHVPMHAPYPPTKSNLSLFTKIYRNTKAQPHWSQALLERCLELVGEGSLFTLSETARRLTRTEKGKKGISHLILSWLAQQHLDLFRRVTKNLPCLCHTLKRRNFKDFQKIPHSQLESY